MRTFKNESDYKEALRLFAFHPSFTRQTFMKDTNTSDYESTRILNRLIDQFYVERWREERFNVVIYKVTLSGREYMNG